MGVSILHRSSEKGVGQVVRNACDWFPLDNFTAKIGTDSNRDAAKEDRMLAKNSADRNRFRDSEDYQNLVEEMRVLADSVGIRFVPFNTDNSQNLRSDDTKPTKEVAHSL